MSESSATPSTVATEHADGAPPPADGPRPTVAEMYGYAYRRAYETGARPGTTWLTYQHRDGFAHAEDVADYFTLRDQWWSTDVLACELAVGRVLDIGCGAGRHALTLSDAGHDLVGVEPSADAVAVARERGVDAHVGTLLAPPTNLGTFDTLLLAGGGLHLLYLPGHGRAALLRLAEMVNPGGRIVGNCPVPAQDAEGQPEDADDEWAYRLRVDHGDERTGWSDWGAAVLLPAAHLSEMVVGTPWTVAQVRYAQPPDVPSYVALLEHDG